MSRLRPSPRPTRACSTCRWQGDAADIRRLAAELTGSYPDLNVVINNAGIQYVEELSAGDVGAAEATVAINLLGPIRLTAALLPTLLGKPHAAIVNVTSRLGFMPSALIPKQHCTPIPSRCAFSCARPRSR